MILVVVAESVVEVYVSFEVLRQVEGYVAEAFIHRGLLYVVCTCDVLTIFQAVCVVYYMFFDLKGNIYVCLLYQYSII